jgi:hypothetical protein
MVTILAVIVVGGGTAYAAASALPKNSVGSKQIKNEAVTPAKLSKAAKAALTGVAGVTGPAGPEGPAGKEGVRGPAGATDVVVRYATATTPNNEGGSAEANCHPGEVATGGGTELLTGLVNNQLVFTTPGGTPIPHEPEGERPTGWYAGWSNKTGAVVTIRVYAVCASP